VPPALAAKYSLALPRYEGSAQIARLPSTLDPASPAPSSPPLDVASMRADYGTPPRDGDPVAAGGSGDPVADFRGWLADAVARAGCDEPNAMCLATVSEAGAPSARFVLLKGIDDAGRFQFYSHATSAKGRDLARPGARAALVFYWERLRRSVRVEGVVSRVADAEADAYFASRPRPSQVGAWASRQSEPMAGRAELEAAAEAAAARFADAALPVPRPRHWGGFAVAPDRVEFWTGRSSRLHERLVYEKRGEGWATSVLGP